MQRETLFQFSIAVLATLCYIGTLHHDYTYDDVLIVRDSWKVNAAAGGVGGIESRPGARSRDAWNEIWAADYWSEQGEGWPGKDLLYRPVALSSYRLVRILAGPEAWPQHLINILLHALASVLVVRLAFQLLGGRVLLGTTTPAVVAGALFAVLPIHNEAVAAIVGRADILVAVGMLAALLCHARLLAARIARKPWPAIGWSAAGAACVFLTLGSKESGAGVIPLLVLWDWVRSRLGSVSSVPAIPAGRQSAAKFPRPPAAFETPWLRGRTFLRLSYLVPPAAAYVVLRYSALDGAMLGNAEFTKTVNVLIDAPAWQQTLGVLQSFGMYWSKTLFPITLSIAYSINSIRLATSPFEAYVVAGAIAFGALLVLILWSLRTRRWAYSFAAAAIILCYLPTSNALTLIQVFFAERLWYVPSIFACILFGAATARIWRLPAGRIALAVVLTAFMGRLWNRNAEWRDNGTLYAAAVRDQPNGVQPLYLFGSWLVQQGRLEEGIGQLQKAVQIDVGYTDAHRALGQAYAHLGKLPQALSHLQSAAMQAPGHAPTERLLAGVSSAMSAAADSELKKLHDAAGQAPDDLQAQLAMVTRLRELGRLSEALAQFAATEPSFSGRAEWNVEYAVTLVLANRIDDAIARYKSAVQLAPNDAQPVVELAMLLLERRQEGDLPLAMEMTSRAVAISPKSPFAQAAQAEVLAVSGDLPGALAAYSRAISLLPADAPQRGIYQQRARALGARD